MITPSLSLDFTIPALPSNITFNRADNTATTINSSGYIESVLADAPRFSYDPITLMPQGLLIEEARSNLFPTSVTFASWTKTRCSVVASSPAVLGPDNVTTAYKWTEDTSPTTTRQISSNTLIAGSNQRTYSFFAKAAERFILKVERTSSFIGFFSHTFNLQTGTASGGGKIEPYKDEWYRCSGQFAPTQSSAGGIIIAVADANGNFSYTGDGTSGLYLFGAQGEDGSFVTSYIPNSGTTAVTRNADVATITGTNFSDFWQAGFGGATVRALPSTVSGIRPLLQFDDGTSNEIIALRGNTTNPELYIVDGGAPQAQIDAGTIAANTAYSLTGWWAANDCKARKDSGAVVTDTTATIPTVTQARLGSDGTNYLNGHLATINYYDQFSGQIYNRRKNKVIFTVI